MLEGQLASIPVARLVEHRKGPQEVSKPFDKISPPRMKHLERHWPQEAKGSPAFLGSRFNKNESFKNVQEMTEMLMAAANELVPAHEFDRRHVFTISFPHSVGVTAVTEISQTDRVVMQDREGTMVKAVKRDRLPETDLVSFDVKPIRQGDKYASFQIGSAFPGEQAPRLITAKRKADYALAPEKDPTFLQDMQYWETHAFIVVE